MRVYRSNGKLFLIGEYIVMDGAKAFALPTRFGQNLFVEKYSNSGNRINWIAKRSDDSLWFEAELELDSLDIIRSSSLKLGKSLRDILLQAKSLKLEFFKTNCSYTCITKLDYPQEWGLGSSSTLIDLVSSWIGIDPFELNKLTFDTSGYDIACASNSQPFIFTNNPITIKKININWDFIDDLYFIYLNKKQDTQAVVGSHYKNKKKDFELINYLSRLVEKTVKIKSLVDFENIINDYQDVLSEFMQLPKIKDLYFSDYSGTVKSLGAWGGDFILVTKRKGFEDYFKNRGYNIIIPFKEMIL